MANWKTKDSAPNDNKNSATSICSYGAIFSLNLA